MNSSDWDKIFEGGRDYSSINELFLDRILSHINEKRDKPLNKALDIGCGTGEVLLRLAEREMNVTGLDFSEVALRKAKERLSQANYEDQAQFIKANIETISLRELRANPDLVINKLAYAFIEDKKSFLEKVKSLIDNDGWVVISTPVLISGVEYSERMQGISVPYEETKDLLNSVFGQVNTFHENYFESKGIEATFLARA